MYSPLTTAGTDGFDQIFSPKKLSRVGSPSSILSPSSRLIKETSPTSMESTVYLLEEAILDSQAKCAAIVTDLSSSESSLRHLADIKQLKQKLESMQNLVNQLRTQI